MGYGAHCKATEYGKAARRQSSLVPVNQIVSFPRLGSAHAPTRKSTLDGAKSTSH